MEPDEMDRRLPQDAQPDWRRRDWLKLATGLLALALIAAIWVVWRWG
jgi:hypothetical protein